MLMPYFFLSFLSSCVFLGLAVLSLWILHCDWFVKLSDNSLFDIVSRFIGFSSSSFHTGGEIDVSVVCKLFLCYSHVKSFTFLICKIVMNVSRRYKMFRNLMEMFFQGYLVSCWSICPQNFFTYLLCFQSK